MRELGASQVVDHTISRFEDVVSEVEVVINLIGNLTDQTSTRSLGLLEQGGLIVSVPTGGWPSMADPVLADLDPADPDPVYLSPAVVPVRSRSPVAPRA